MIINTITTIEEFNKIVETEEAALFYFSHEQCNVCKVLKPKVAYLLESDFPKINMYFADTVLSPEIAGQNSVFAVPTMLVFFGGREYIRKSRNIGLHELEDALQRPYELIFQQT
jgi:thioredoxin-like negative regulator of GroEL